MKLALMQPYFFPYLGQFHLIASVDKWIAFDTVQYIRDGWMHRNRILHPNEGWQYVSVPIARHSKSTPIKDVAISRHYDYRTRLLAQVAHYRRHAPHYSDVIQFLERCFSTDEQLICRLNVRLLRLTCEHLGLPFKHEFLSEATDSSAGIDDPGERVLSVCRAYGATEYLSPAGGLHLLDPIRFAQAGIRLSAQAYWNLEYTTSPYPFVPGLSVIDALMWNTPDALRDHLQAQRVDAV